jgi:hypothetical protein
MDKKIGVTAATPGQRIGLGREAAVTGKLHRGIRSGPGRGHHTLDQQPLQ